MGMWVGRGRKARVGVRLRRHRAGPGSRDHQSQRGGHLLGALRPSLRDPDHRGGHGRRRRARRFAIEMGRLGGLAVLNLEGIFSRYENPDEVLDRIISASHEEATKIIQSHLRRADQGGADPQAHPRDQEGRRAGRRLLHPAARRALRQDRRGGRRRLLRRPVHRDHRPAHRHRVRRRWISGSSRSSSRSRSSSATASPTRRASS